MATVLRVEHQDFSFGDDWLVLKYDECADYRRLQVGTESANAVDIVGVIGEWLFVIEAKDYRVRGQRMTHNQLAQWVSTKVRDTLAGVTGFHRTSTNPDLWRRSLSAIREQEGRVVVVLFVEDYEVVERDERRWKPKAMVIRQLLRQKMSWLNPRIDVVSQASQNIKGLTVTSRPGAAGR